MNMYRLISSIARPMDETLSIARLIVRGLWERFPMVKLVGCHGGGGICEVIGRMDTPPLNPLLPKAIELVNSLPLTEVERASIFHRNAEQLLGLESGIPEVVG